MSHILRSISTASSNRAMDKIRIYEGACIPTRRYREYLTLIKYIMGCKRIESVVVSQEEVLAELAKKGAGGGFALASLMGAGGSKFGALDIKRVYFG